MKTSKLILFFAGISGSSGALSEPFDFDCRAPLEQSWEIWRTGSAAAFHVRGSIEPAGLEPLAAETTGEGRDIRPVTRGADITILDPSDGAYVALGIVAGPEGGSFAIQVLSANGTDEEVAPISTIAWQPGAVVSVPFEIEAAGHQALVEVAGREVRRDVPFGPRSEVGASCIGGLFWFPEFETRPIEA